MTQVPEVRAAAHVAAPGPLARLLPDLAGLLLPGGPEVVSLCPGPADEVVLAALRAAGRRPRFRAASVDLSAPLALEAWKARPGEAARLVLLLGEAFAAVEPELLMSELRRLLRRGDHVLLETALRSSEALLALMAEVGALEVVRHASGGEGDAPGAATGGVRQVALARPLA